MRFELELYKVAHVDHFKEIAQMRTWHCVDTHINREWSVMP